MPMELCPNGDHQRRGEGGMVALPSVCVRLGCRCGVGVRDPEVQE